VFLTVGAIGMADDKKEDQKDDKTLLQGEWPVVSSKLGGTETAQKDQELVIKGDKWTAPSGGKFKLDAGKEPKHLDLVSSRAGKEQTWPGIYKIEGDTFTFCRSATSNGERPKEFKADPGVFLLVCKRAGK
jgi:uncharacterized protein (TIGR03067 family)